MYSLGAFFSRLTSDIESQNVLLETTEDIRTARLLPSRPCFVLNIHGRSTRTLMNVWRELCLDYVSRSDIGCRFIPCERTQQAPVVFVEHRQREPINGELLVDIREFHRGAIVILESEEAVPDADWCVELENLVLVDPKAISCLPSVDSALPSLN